MHCFKRLGERVMARTFEHQVSELHVRVALLKPIYTTGPPHDGGRARYGIAAPGVGITQLKFGLSNEAVLSNELGIIK